MKIPKHLALPGMPAEQKKRVVAFVKECRKALSKSPAFDTTEEAVDEAVKQAKKEEFSFPSVWKEPRDVGQKHTVVHTKLREKAQNAGYTEEVGEQKIFDLANGIKRDETDEIEEVD